MTEKTTSTEAMLQAYPLGFAEQYRTPMIGWLQSRCDENGRLSAAHVKQWRQWAAIARFLTGPMQVVIWMAILALTLLLTVIAAQVWMSLAAGENIPQWTIGMLILGMGGLWMGALLLITGYLQKFVMMYELAHEKTAHLNLKKWGLYALAVVLPSAPLIAALVVSGF